MRNTEIGTNFREIRAGNIAAGIIYRSGHPFEQDDATHKAISRLAKNADIKCILNLHDKHIVLEKFSKDVLWYNTLVKEKKVIGLNMDMNIPGVDFNKKLKKGLRFMLANGGPYLIHCFAGIDRTGFMVAVLEALMGGSMEDICYDYSLSFNDTNLSSSIILCFEKGKDDPYLKEQIFLKFEKINNYLPVTDENIQLVAENYLLGAVGLDEAELLALKSLLSSSAV